jgi:hypothetical protein
MLRRHCSADPGIGRSLAQADASSAYAWKGGELVSASDEQRHLFSFADNVLGGKEYLQTQTNR